MAKPFFLEKTSKFNLAHLVVPCLMLVLTSCSFGPTTVDGIIAEAVNNQDSKVRTDKTEETVEFFIRQASENDGETRRKHLIKAAELLFERGDISMPPNPIKDATPAQIENTRQMQIRLVAARIAHANRNPEAAIELIPKASDLNANQRLEANDIRATVNLEMGYTMNAIESLVGNDDLYLTREEREFNHKAIWTALSSLPSVVLKKEKSDDKVIQGWIELARIVRKAQQDSNKLKNNILDWGTKFPNHPVSNEFINTLLDEYLNQYDAATRIAVLLPLQGRLQGIGDAIKNGFLSAFYEDKQGGEKPSIKFYDTSGYGSEEGQQDFAQLYQRATFEGANYMVGPFNKSILNDLADTKDSDIPVLTLNYSESPLSTTDNLYQFGLLPEDEAIQVAEMAIRQNKMNAAILVPDSDWGRRLLNAFQHRYIELGGTVVNSQYFNARSDDHAQSIKSLFNLNSSYRRYKDLQGFLKTKLKFTKPYRRQDIDMIFLGATYRSARSIMPAFRFHHASNIPVFATSHVYTGHANKKADADLNGLMFCDLPWTLINNNNLRKVFNEQWPEQLSYTRLFALGIDAYHIINNINYLKNLEYARFSGQTGNIYLDENNRLHRELLWAKFRKGKAKYIDTTTAPDKSLKNGKDKS